MCAIIWHQYPHSDTEACEGEQLWLKGQQKPDGIFNYPGQEKAFSFDAKHFSLWNFRRGATLHTYWNYGCHAKSYSVRKERYLE